VREYDSGIGKTALAPVIIAVLIVAGFGVTLFWPPGGNGATTTTTTTTTNGGGDGYGPLAATFLNSKREDVVFFWMCNSSFVNEDLSTFYDQQHAGAFVDGVQMWRNSTNYCRIEVLFSPAEEGSGEVGPTTWFSLSGSLIDDGIGQMDDALSHPDYWPQTYPIDFFVEVYFEDLTMFYIGYTSSDGLVYICNGTWTGSYTAWGWPETGDYFEGHWLTEGGHLQTPISMFYSTITNTVSYPE
jgi:hypothetical protein